MDYWYIYSHQGNGLYRIQITYSANNGGFDRQGGIRIDLQTQGTTIDAFVKDIFQYRAPATNPYYSQVFNAANGSTITINPGEYTGHLVIAGKSNVTIQGAGINQTTIKSAGQKPTIEIINCTNVTIKYMTITSGSSAEGGGIRIINSRVTVENCLIKDNTNRTLYTGGPIISTYGGGIYLAGFNSTAVVKKSIIYSNSADIGRTAAVIGGSLTFEASNLLESVPYENYYYALQPQVIFRNSIIKNADTSIGSFDYCASYNSGTLPGSNNITTTDPRFVDPANGDYRLQKGSPCIGKGYNPDYDDPFSAGYDQYWITALDETQDIGAIAYNGDRYAKYSFSNDAQGNWMCFPVIDDHSTINAYGGSYTANIVGAFFAQYAVQSSAMNNVSYKWFDSINVFRQQTHYPNEPILNQVMHGYLGYLALFNQASTMPASGFYHGYHIPYNTPVPLPVADEENWIGYFIPETQSAFDAFGSYLASLYFIQHKDWTMARVKPKPGSTWLVTGKPTLSYGEMVKVKRFSGSSNNFVWTRLTQSRRHERLEPEFFEFTKEPEYTAIFVQLDSLSTAQELAVFFEGQCYGAAVVKEDGDDPSLYLLIISW